MKDYRPLLIRRLDARLPGLRVLRLRLNRHLPEADALEEHRHAFAQTLCYLAGRGTLELEGGDIAIGPGSLALIPQGTVHGFREGSGRRPLTLAIDFETAKERCLAARVVSLNASEAARIREALSRLGNLPDPSGEDARLVACASALTILDVELRALGELARPRTSLPGFVRKFDRAVRDPEALTTPIGTLAARTGYQPDYLNRKFKEVTGLTLHQHRDGIRLAGAKRALAEGMGSGGAAAAAGFDDPNYFSRWFKRQTGLRPRDFGTR